MPHDTGARASWGMVRRLLAFEICGFEFRLQHLYVYLLWVWCSVRSLCAELITRPEEFYWMKCVMSMIVKPRQRGNPVSQRTCVTISYSKILVIDKGAVSSAFSRPHSWNPLSSSSIGTATLVGFGHLNYRWVFSVGMFLQSAVASGTSNPQPGGPVITTFQLPPPGAPHVWNDASEPQQRKVELCERNCREFYRKWRLPRYFWVRLHAVNLRHGTGGFTSLPKEGALRIFSPEKSDGFGRVWTRELWY